MRKALRYMGLAVRAGKATIGAEDCSRELRRRKGGLLVAAADASDGTLSEMRALCGERKIRLLSVSCTKEEMGRAVGRATPVAIVYIGDDGLADAFAAAAELDREQEERV